MTTIIAGVSLGYNYSLAEYVELKDTNVSVYLKRGIFNDKLLGKSLRSGDEPEDVVNLREASTSVTASPVDYDIVEKASSRKKLEKNLQDAAEHDDFEGSLYKLTSNYLLNTKLPDVKLYQNGLDNDLRLIQSLIDLRKSKNTLETTPRWEETVSRQDVWPLIKEKSTDIASRDRHGATRTTSKLEKILLKDAYRHGKNPDHYKKKLMAARRFKQQKKLGIPSDVSAINLDLLDRGYEKSITAIRPIVLEHQISRSSPIETSRRFSRSTPKIEPEFETEKVVTRTPDYAKGSYMKEKILFDKLHTPSEKSHKLPLLEPYKSNTINEDTDYAEDTKENFDNQPHNARRFRRYEEKSDSLKFTTNFMNSKLILN